MKKFIIAFALFAGLASFSNHIEARDINIHINIDRQPAWGPIGYDYVDYYYFPEINCYYGVNTGLYHYYDRGRWIAAHYLPYGYSDYDLYGLYKVVLNVSKPWRHNKHHVRDYRHYVGHRHQVIIRDSREHRYHHSRNNRYSWYSDNHNHKHSYSSDRKNNYSYYKSDRGDYNRDRSYNKPNRNNRSNDKYSNNRKNKERDSRVYDRTDTGQSRRQR